MAILGLGKSKKSKAFDAPAQTASQTPRVSDLTVGDYANGMPRIRLGEFFNSLLRQLKWVVPLLLLGTAGIWFATKDLKRTYSGEGLKINSKRMNAELLISWERMGFLILLQSVQASRNAQRICARL